MENLEHELWIVQAINAVFGPAVAALLRAIGRPVPDPAHVIPNYLAVILLIIVAPDGAQPVGAIAPERR